MPDKLITAGVKHMKFWHRAGKTMAMSTCIWMLSFTNALRPQSI